jgi:hypothetical protein
VRDGVEMVRDFEKSTKDNPVQARDKDTNERVWQIEVIDADPGAKGSVKVKPFGDLQPVPPALQQRARKGHRLDVVRAGLGGRAGIRALA